MSQVQPLESSFVCHFVFLVLDVSSLINNLELYKSYPTAILFMHDIDSIRYKKNDYRHDTDAHIFNICLAWPRSVGMYTKTNIW